MIATPNSRTVVLNGRFSGTLEPTGTQVVAFSLFEAMVEADRDFDLVIFADPACRTIGTWGGFPRTELIPTPFSRWSRTKSQLWEQFVLPWECRRRHASLVHHPIMTCPRWALGVPTLVTLHDLNFYHHPEWVAPAFRRWLMHTAVPGVRAAEQVVTISDYVLRDLRTTLQVQPERTCRIYNGLKAPPPLAEATRQPRTILGVNLWQPHKNLLRLLDALQILRQEWPDLELHLAGRPQAQFRQQPTLAARLQEPGIRVLGYLSDSALAEAYATATVFCYPSLEEGFGLPILEAMAAGTPVVTSNTSCLPEIAGGAAVLIDPLDPADLARGLRDALVEGPAERKQRIEHGREVSSRFSWKTAAQEYFALYRKFLPVVHPHHD